jgi:hypothetical protein
MKIMKANQKLRELHPKLHRIDKPLAGLPRHRIPIFRTPRLVEDQPVVEMTLQGPCHLLPCIPMKDLPPHHPLPPVLVLPS